jgi:outer membrane protein OmpA-like peptidoglycan-associated protein
MRSPLPRLEAICEPSGYVRNLPPNALASLRNFRGLLLEESLLVDNEQFLPRLFFDSGSAAPNERYRFFTDPSQTRDFSDTTLRGGTLQNGYEIVNIIGHRLRKYPIATITIIGANSGERGSRENREVSRKRAEYVRDYLRTIWGIDPQRMTIVARHGIPQIPSATKDTLGAAENRRVEILSDDYRILQPITRSELRRYPQPDSMTFRIDNGMPAETVASREIEIRWNNELWYVMRDIGISDTISPAFWWGRGNDMDVMLMPMREFPFVARLVVHTTDGRELRSAPVEIPVRIVRSIAHPGCFEGEIIARVGLALFEFDRSAITPFSRRVMREYILPEIPDATALIVTGHTDCIGSEEHNQQLSERRARAWAQAFRASGGRAVSISSRGCGERCPLYRNDLPEGRFYNRTVRVLVTRPAKDHE